MVALTSLFVILRCSLILGMIGFTSVHGCGQLPQGQVNAMSFEVSNFTLPAAMVYSANLVVQSGITSISHTKETAIKVVQDLIINAINDVLQEQGRNALLLDAVIQQILQQLNVTIEYTPLECKTATKDPANAAQQQPRADMDGCIIIEEVVRGLCTKAAVMCSLMPPNIANVLPTPAKYRTVKGSLKTSNVIMATWSKAMWQSVLNRVFQRILSGQFRKYFISAVATVTS